MNYFLTNYNYFVVCFEGFPCDLCYKGSRHEMERTTTTVNARVDTSVHEVTKLGTDYRCRIQVSAIMENGDGHETSKFHNLIQTLFRSIKVFIYLTNYYI